MKTIVVVSERGRLVGVYQPVPESATANATLLPSKGQKQHELQVDEALVATARDAELLRFVKRRFRLK